MSVHRKSTRKQQLRFLSQTWFHINVQGKKRASLILESVTGSPLFNVAKTITFLSKIEKIHQQHGEYRKNVCILSKKKKLFKKQAIMHPLAKPTL